MIANHPLHLRGRTPEIERGPRLGLGNAPPHRRRAVGAKEHQRRPRRIDDRNGERRAVQNPALRQNFIGQPPRGVEIEHANLFHLIGMIALIQNLSPCGR
jgi:hypothetical protein